MNRINQLFETKQKNVCNIFLTAGFPSLNDTVSIVHELEKNGADMVEIGMPFSDPLADGETIQESSLVALENGMTIELLFEQVKEIRLTSEIPIVLMGYFNPVFKYGLENFLSKCEETGVDGLIIPDISLEEYELNYKTVFDQFNIPLTFLFTPKTSVERIHRIEQLSTTFMYFVSSASTTGTTGEFSESQIKHFKKVKEMKLKSPTLMGFGINNQANFEVACTYFNGGIIGSAFIRAQRTACSIQVFMEGLKS